MMTKRYNVELNRSTTIAEYCYIEIDADSAEEAEEKALSMSSAGDKEIVWESGDIIDGTDAEAEAALLDSEAE